MLYEGTGLGLAISKRLSEAMGGQMWVETEIDRGSTFRFTMMAMATNNMLRRSIQNFGYTGKIDFCSYRRLFEIS
nr:ATP-binding protein [Okeania sp. SIO1H2]